MPLYPIKCLNPECGKPSDVFIAVDQRHMLRCPDCNSLAEQDYTRKTVGVGGAMIKFTGERQESVIHLVDPKERERYGTLGSCIQNDHTVRFPDRETQRKFSRRTHEIEQEDKARWAAQNEKDKANGTKERRREYGKKRAREIMLKNIAKSKEQGGRRAG